MNMGVLNLLHLLCDTDIEQKCRLSLYLGYPDKDMGLNFNQIGCSEEGLELSLSPGSF